MRCVVLPEVWGARAIQEVAGVGALPGGARQEGAPLGAAAVHTHLRLDYSAAARLPEDARPAHATVSRVIVF